MGGGEKIVVVQIPIVYLEKIVGWVKNLHTHNGEEIVCQEVNRDEK